MRLYRGFVVPGVFLICALHGHYAHARGPSTPEERARVVALTRLLEQDPLDENAAATRQWLRKWTVEVPDIKVYACDDLLGHGLGDTYPYSNEIKLQVVFSAAAFAIENQHKARDEIAQYSAGVQGALRAYEVLLKSKPDARSAFLDEFLVKRHRGELVDHVAKLADEKCKRANTDLIATLAGAAVGLVLALLVALWFGGPPAGQVTSLSISARTATSFQWIVFGCAAYYVIVGMALHFLEPEFDPRFRFMSEYVWGAYGWLMTTTFFVLGLAAFLVAWGLRGVHQSPRSARVGFGLLVVGALFICLAGVFRDFVPHFFASAVAIPSVIMAALVLSWSFRQAAGWQAIYRATLLIAIGMLVAFLSINAHVGPPGLLQRVFLCLFLLWLCVVVHRLVRVTRRAS